MNQTRTPYSGYAQHPGEAAYPAGYSSQPTYLPRDESPMYSVRPDPQATPYGLADDPARGQPQKAAKKVRTTLGRAQGPKRGRPIVAVDPNARMVSAFRPGAMPAAQVRMVDDRDGPAVEAPVIRRAPSLAYLRPLIAREPFAYRLLFATTALILSGAYLLALLVFWAPAHPGADEHARLVAGRLLAEQQNVRLAPADPFAFVGEGWVATGNVNIADNGLAVQELVPRAPIGLSAPYAAAFRFAPTPGQALLWTHLVAPVSAALAVLGTFYLARYAGGSFLATLAMIAMAAGQLLLGRAGIGTAEHASLALATWGFVLLIRWWRCGNALVGLAAGLLVGYAGAVTYPAALLGGPLVLACLFAWHWRRPFVSTLRILVPMIGWALPMAGLLYFNDRELGAWTAWHLAGETGLIDPDNVAHNWQALLWQLNDGGLYFLLPLGLVGLLTLCARRLPLGLVLLAWCVLPVLGHASYASADSEGFAAPLLLSLTPVVLFGAAYLMRRVLYAPSDAPAQLVEGEDPRTGELVYMLAEPATPFWRSVMAPVAAGLIVTAALGIGASRAGAGEAAGEIEQRHIETANLAALGDFVRGRVTPGSVLFIDVPLEDGSAAHHLDITGDYTLFEASMFSQRFARRLGAPAETASEEGVADRMDRRRHEYLRTLYEGMSDAELSAVVHRIVDRALDGGGEAYLLMNDVEARRFEQTHLLRGYETRTAATYHAWPAVPLVDKPGETRSAPEWKLVRITRPPQLAAPGAVERAGRTGI